MSLHIPLGMAREVRERAQEICEYCLLPQNSQEATFHIDHVVPRTAGGKTETNNLALACVSCSLRKAAKLNAVDPQSQETVGLFHHRRDRWLDHFKLTDEFEIVGLTPTGRATLATLAMNRTIIVSIRKELNFLGRFPPSHVS